jgi:hypothetical protein
LKRKVRLLANDGSLTYPKQGEREREREREICRKALERYGKRKKKEER